MPSTMGNSLGDFLQGVGYHAALLRPLIPMYLHLILSALFPIFIGAHASLSRPSSAAKPLSKDKKHSKDGDKDSEAERKMEGLTPMDALLFPVMGGLTLATLYYIIKYLEDPAILNTIMNWYFAAFGVLSLTRLLTDTMVFQWSIIFPDMYHQGGELWKVDRKSRKMSTTKETNPKRDSHLPGYLALLPLPVTIKQFLWTLREIPSNKLNIYAYIHQTLKADFKIGTFGVTSLFLAIAAELYFNLIDKPWYLTNLFGFSFSYAALQIMSPTTAWTATLILSGLFFYDIYFVFFTPMMVTVATKIDIPAKLMFPRPEAGGMSMLGLGDVVLPGIVIGFALRFDLFLHYLRKQSNTHEKKEQQQRRSTRITKKVPDDTPTETETETPKPPKPTKANYISATGNWGNRLWTSTLTTKPLVEHASSFPKPYFHATLTGYTLGLMTTLGVMQVFGHAQPALLYLVPGVLGALWGTAFLRGEVGVLWGYSEDEDDGGDRDGDVGKGEEGKGKVKGEGEEGKGGWMDWSSVTGWISKQWAEGEEREKRARDAAEKKKKKGEKVGEDAVKDAAAAAAGSGNGDELDGADKDKDKDKGDGEKNQSSLKKWDGNLLSFSISLPEPLQEE